MKNLLCLLLCSLFFWASADEFTVPYAKTAPQIDGIFQEEEWADALEISGCGTPIDHRHASFYLKFDDQNVYCAVVSETPPKGKLLHQSGHIVLDDSVELQFMPPEELRTIEALKFGRFQFIGNFLGDELWLHYEPGYGLPTREWKHGASEIAQKITNDVWCYELRLPAQSFGLDAIPESDWKILPVRNFRTPPSNQYPFSETANFFSDFRSFATYHFRRNAGAVQQEYTPGTRLPLTFTSSDATASATWTQDGAEHTDAPLPLTIPQATDASGKYLVSVKNAAGQILFRKTFETRPAPERIYFTPESYLLLEDDFEEGKAPYSTVEGRRKNTRALYLSNDGESISHPDFHFKVPCNISFWVKPDDSPIHRYRRFFAIHQPGAGYLGFQIQPDNLPLFFLHDFPEEPRLNVMPSAAPTAQEWNHLSFNLFADRVEFYLNGFKLVERKLPFTLGELAELDFNRSGDGGFALDEYSVFSRPLTADEIKVFAQNESAVKGELAFFPTRSIAQADLTVNAADFPEGGFLWEIRDMSGNVFHSQEIPLSHAYPIHASNQQLLLFHEKATLETPLADGSYILAVKQPGKTKGLLEKEILVKHYPWENNTLGTSDIVLPGFTALKRDGNDLHCILRKYRIADNGFPESVESMGQEILAAPVTLNLGKDGEVRTVAGNGVVFGKCTDTTVEYTAQAEGFTIRGHLEQDGMLKFDIAFPDDLEADSVYLDVPLKKEYAKLFHAVGDEIRSNPAGFLPEGEGTIFTPAQVPMTHISDFVPYLWLGTDDRGICYAADWDKGWCYSAEHPAQALVRHPNGDVSLRLNFLNAPVVPEKGRVITFLLMATPAKALPEGWRGWSESFNYKGTRFSQCLISPAYWGGYYCYMQRYPSWEDFEYVRKLKEAKETGVIDHDFVNAWIDRAVKDPKGEGFRLLSKEKDPRDYCTRHTNAGFYLARSLYGKPDAVMYYYTCDKDDATGLPEYPAFADEWTGNIVPSYQDYAIYHFNKMLDAGMNGIYNDCPFLVANYQWARGYAYIDSTGTVHPGFGLWLSREWHKRELTLMAERGIANPWMTVHHTNTCIVPTMSFFTNTMGMEWKYGVTDFQDRFSPDYIRVVDAGRQCGAFPTVLDGIMSPKTQEEKDWCTRTMLATLLPHHIKPTCPRNSNAEIIRNTYDLLFDFGYHEEDCEYLPYWDEANPATAHDDGILTSTYRRGDKLLVVCSSNRTDTEVRLTVNGTVGSARDLESGAALPVEGNAILFPLKKHDFKLVEIAMEDKN